MINQLMIKRSRAVASGFTAKYSVQVEQRFREESDIRFDMDDFCECHMLFMAALPSAAVPFVHR